MNLKAEQIDLPRPPYSYNTDMKEKVKGQEPNVNIEYHTFHCRVTDDACPAFSESRLSAWVPCTKSICSTPEVMWSIMASFMLYVVDKYAWDFYMENANF